MAQIGSGAPAPFLPPSPSLRRTELLRYSRHGSEVLPLERSFIEEDPRQHLARLTSLGGVVQLTRPPAARKKTRKCFRCSVRKCKCETTPGGDLRCAQCIKFQIPPFICSPERVTDFHPFEKWKDETYKNLFTGVIPVGSKSQRAVELVHYAQGPILKVICSEFLPIYDHQIRALMKDGSGWHSVTTTAFCLADKVDIALHVKASIHLALDEARNSKHAASFVFKLVWYYRDHSLINDCLEMYTALRLIIVGCQFSGPETLGMAVVDDPVSAWYGRVPVPRMVKNQVNHLLELRMIELDRKITDALSRLPRDRHLWIVGTLAVFLLLHIRELDAGRNIYWARYKDSAGFWIHPSRPSALIDEGVASCNSLLRYFHCSLGRQPLCQNWDEERSQRLVNDDAVLIASMKTLQSCVSMMRQEGWIGRNASQLYEDGHPDSVGLTISSLIFTEMADAQVKGFH